MPMARHFANGFATFAAQGTSILMLRLRSVEKVRVLLLRLRRPDDLHEAHRLVEDPTGKQRANA